MPVVEDPFVSRDSILDTYGLRQSPRDRDWWLLRARGAVSPGVRIPLRRGSGASSERVFSALNRDAARAARAPNLPLARQLARAARELERSEPATRLLAAVKKSAMDVDTLYDRRQRPSSAAGRGGGFTPAAWLTSVEAPETLAEPLLELSRATAEARARLWPESGTIHGAVGAVHRLSPSRAEVVTDSGKPFEISRAELARRGLDRIGSPVAVFVETTNALGTSVFIEPAAVVPVAEREVAGFDRFDRGGAELTGDDAKWFAAGERELALVGMLDLFSRD